jgi:quinol monooxygenase YgiN
MRMMEVEATGDAREEEVAAAATIAAAAVVETRAEAATLKYPAEP